MGSESNFTEEVWNSWLEPFHAVRMLIEAGLDDREHAVNWLKGRLRGGELCAGGLHIQLLGDSLTASEWVFARYKPQTWTHVAAIPWKDDFWVSGDYQPDDPLDYLRRTPEPDEFSDYLTSVRFEPILIKAFCERVAKPPVLLPQPTSRSVHSAGGRPPKLFWDSLWASVAAQLYNGDLKPKRQSDIERAMHDWLVTNGHDAGETAVRAKAKQLWYAINSEVEN